MQHPPATFRHLREPRPLPFPTRAETPQTKRHLALRTALYDVLLTAFAPEASIGSEQFVYWNARDPGRCLAPDAFVKLGVPDSSFTSWKTWERGTPELAVEILSESDERRGTWPDKLERYHELGVRELVAFDADAPPGQRLRIWDRIEDDLIERVIDADSSPCATLGGSFVMGSVPGAAVALRLAVDAAGLKLLPTGRELEARGREEAEARVAALEAAEGARGRGSRACPGRAGRGPRPRDRASTPS